MGWHRVPAFFHPWKFSCSFLLLLYLVAKETFPEICLISILAFTRQLILSLCTNLSVLSPLKHRPGYRLVPYKMTSYEGLCKTVIKLSYDSRNVRNTDWYSY